MAFGDPTQTHKGRPQSSAQRRRENYYKKSICPRGDRNQNFYLKVGLFGPAEM
jgi:hypothetical protein